MTEELNIKKVPVTILTGSLGSGKTTFLNNILSNQEHKLKIAVVQNEFGEQIGVEKLLSTLSVQDKKVPMIELSNGCICCSVKSDLVFSLEQLIQNYQVDHIIIETSGLADPGPLATKLWLDEELLSKISLNTIITIVDSKNFELLLPNKIFQKQTAYADIILLNKIDLLESPHAQIQRLKLRLETLNPVASILQTKFSSLLTQQLLNLFQTNSFSEKKFSFLEKKFKQSKISEHSHELTVSSIVLRSKEKLKKKEFERMLGEYLWEKADEEKVEIFRIKGFIQLKEVNFVCIVQGVYDTFELVETEIPWDEKGPRTELIFIGKNLENMTFST
eukprot:snap_masked-scaffold_24-processed-gene-0.33-mRNA-1 protein AED:0.22 eAED:0.24 QI:0/-1/0/1/-1/1/1/0/332